MPNVKLLKTNLKYSDLGPPQKEYAQNYLDNERKRILESGDQPLTQREEQLIYRACLVGKIYILNIGYSGRSQGYHTLTIQEDLYFHTVKSRKLDSSNNTVI